MFWSVARNLAHPGEDDHIVLAEVWFGLIVVVLVAFFAWLGLPRGSRSDRAARAVMAIGTLVVVALGLAFKALD